MVFIYSSTSADKFVFNRKCTKQTTKNFNSGKLLNEILFDKKIYYSIPSSLHGYKT